MTHVSAGVCLQWYGRRTPRVRRGDSAAGRPATEHQQIYQAGWTRSGGSDQGLYTGTLAATVNFVNMDFWGPPKDVCVNRGPCYLKTEKKLATVHLITPTKRNANTHTIHVYVNSYCLK